MERVEAQKKCDVKSVDVSLIVPAYNEEENILPFFMQYKMSFQNRETAYEENLRG